MQHPATKSRRRGAPGLSARLSRAVRLETHANGGIIACVGDAEIHLGAFSAAAADRAAQLRTGLPFGALVSGSEVPETEIEVLARRLAGHGLLEYCIGHPSNGPDDLIVIEPQMPGYWPRMLPLGDADTLVLSRFAWMRRRGNEMVLESPRAGALFRFRDPKLASLVAALGIPRRIGELRRQDGFPGVEFFALLTDCQIAFTVDSAGEGNLRLVEGDHSLALWDFHDLLFHARSTEGRHANAVGGVYPHGGVIAPLPVVRPSWSGEKLDLCACLTSPAEATLPVVRLLRGRHSTRHFDDRHPITLAELSRFLDGTARILPRPDGAGGFGDLGAAEAARPYPSAGASYELELYLAVNICDGLGKGFYHYDPEAHRLASIAVSAAEVKALLMQAAYAMGVSAPPQILITIAARFGRVSWKYSSIAYALVLKDVGVLTQTLYLVAAEMGLGGCAIGTTNIDQFAKMTGIEYHIEGPVGQFAIGRGATSGSSG